MKEKNKTLAILEAVAAICVVLVHFQFPGALGRILCATGVAGVILFLLASGYFSYESDQAETGRRVMKRFWRNLRILLCVVALYFAVTAIEKLAQGSFGQWIEGFKSPTLWARMIFLGDFEIIHGDPLWYMAAILYCYLLFALISKARAFRLAHAAIPLLLALRIGMETYTNSFGADWHLSGNAIVGVLPIMLLGHWIAQRRGQNSSEPGDKPTTVTAIALAISLALMYVSVNVRVAELDLSQVFKISSATLAFLLALQKPGLSRPAFLVFVGSALGVWIYLLHYIIGTVIKDAMLFYNAGDLAINWILPPVVIVTSVLVAALLNIVVAKKRSDS
ncbi:MAG: acyltransferase [Treponema sp.]|nr:acyltransferase [Treponema sp.]